MPATFEEIAAGAFQHCERGFEPDSGRGIGAREQQAQGFKRGGGELVELVGDAGVEMAPGLFDRGTELLRGVHPILDRGAVDSGGSRGGDDGAALGERGDDLDLDGRQTGGFKGR